MKNFNQKTETGITLIALIITIIILVILAAVSIRSVYNMGIVNHAINGTTEYEKAAKNENNLMENSKSFIENTLENLDRIQDNYVFNEEEIVIGDAINANKYGYKVNTYTPSQESGYTGIWRLFYQDNKLTYIIADEGQGSYNMNSIYSNYDNGANVTIIGKRLNSKINSLFTEDNTRANIRGIAFFTDSTKWDKYKDDGGDVVCVIASPTLELYVASYNGTAKKERDREELQQLELDEYGYTSVFDNIVDNNHGIYEGNYWMASPFSVGSSSDTFYFYMCQSETVGGSYPPMMTSNTVKPIVCIPTKVFEKNYTLTDE